MRLKPLFLCATLAVCAGAQANTLVSSTFDAGSEGWSAINQVASQGWVSTGGAPGGYFAARDAGQGTVWSYNAPAAFLGNQLAAIGGALSFDLKTSTLDSPMQSWGDVKIAGGGIELVLDAGASPGLEWTSYSVMLTPGAWRLGDLNGALATATDFQTVLSNVEFLRIRGEFSAAIDQGGLDNVMLTSPIPEPASLLMMLAGLAGVGAMARKRKA
jgi:hypothetical protein